MRTSILAFAFFAALPALAQPSEPETRASRKQRIVLGAAGVAGGLIATYITADVLGDNGASVSTAVPFLVLSYPVGATVTIRVLGPVVGTAPGWTAAAQDVLIGAAGGAAVTTVGLLVGTAVGGGDEYFPIGTIVGGLVGGGGGIATAVLLTSRRIQVAPTALVAPTGERAPGMSLALSL